jgi:hypothetical protein
MFPERRVTLNTYGDHRLARRDLRRLTRAGIQAHLGGEYFRFHGTVELQVSESEAERALKVLDLDDADELVPAPPLENSTNCPECGAPARLFPPYPRYLLIAGVAILALSVVLGRAVIGFVVLVVAYLGATFLGAKTGRYICTACRYDWLPM